MILFLHFLFPVTILALLFFAYMAFFKDWSERSYENSKNTFPFSLIAFFGKKFYVWYFRVSIVVDLIAAIFIYILFLRPYL